MDIILATWLGYYNEAMNTLEMCVDTACDYADTKLMQIQALEAFE